MHKSLSQPGECWDFRFCGFGYLFYRFLGVLAFAFRFSPKYLRVFGFGIRCGFRSFPIWVRSEQQLCASTDLEWGSKGIGMGHDKPNVTKITSFRWNNIGIRVFPPFFKRVEERRRGSHAVFGFDRFYNFFFSFAALNYFKWCSTSVLDVTLDVSYDTCAKRCACDIEIQIRLL